MRYLIDGKAEFSNSLELTTHKGEVLMIISCPDSMKGFSLDEHQLYEFIGILHHLQKQIKNKK